MQKCKDCKIEKPFEDFHKHKAYKSGYNSRCKPCRAALAVKRFKGHSVELKMLWRARGRANKKSLACNIELSDIVIPETCPVLLTKMKHPSLDRIVPLLGYTKGNVRVISNRANMLKNNATVTEMELIIADLQRISQ